MSGMAATDSCPRCAGSFACGAAGAAPCPCTTVKLSDALQMRLRQQFSGCLCLACLRTLAAHDGPGPAGGSAIDASMVS